MSEPVGYRFAAVRKVHKRQPSRRPATTGQRPGAAGHPVGRLVGRLAELVRRAGLARIVIQLWILALAIAWVGEMWQGYGSLVWIKSSPPMCDGLPSYRSIAPEVPAAGVTFLADPSDPRSSERFFCAQYALSPIPVVALYWPSLEVGSHGLPAAENLLIDVANEHARRRLAADLRTEASRHGKAVVWEELGNGLAVVEVDGP